MRIEGFNMPPANLGIVRADLGDLPTLTRLDPDRLGWRALHGRHGELVQRPPGVHFLNKNREGGFLIAGDVNGFFNRCKHVCSLPVAISFGYFGPECGQRFIPEPVEVAAQSV